MKTNSIARMRLEKALAPTMTQAELARRLGVSQQALSAWVNGVSTPKPKYMAAIERLFGIPMAEWMQQPVVVAPPAPASAPQVTKARAKPRSRKNARAA